MQRQITYGRWLDCDTARGVYFIPWGDAPRIVTDALDEDYGEPDVGIELSRTALLDLEMHLPCKADDIYNLESRYGYGARVFSPGYSDCAEWSVFDTESEAELYLEEYYGDE